MNREDRVVRLSGDPQGGAHALLRWLQPSEPRAAVPRTAAPPPGAKGAVQRLHETAHSDSRRVAQRRRPQQPGAAERATASSRVLAASKVAKWTSAAS